MSRNDRVTGNGTGKLATDGGQDLGQNPFGALAGLGLPPGPPASAKAEFRPSPAGGEAPKKNRGRVDILRTKAGRGGKTVTVVRGFVGIGLPEKEQLAKKMQKACGCGGTVKDGQIEVQGDKREDVARILAEAGFRPVFAGG
ncbi:translation initiation factor eIF-1/SUI1-like protein [Opitutaceae bacterium TAV1]|nr:translation initiation factor eIF-1/SUI1-like protein [Opitutaceae bacterium TAV1]